MVKIFALEPFKPRLKLTSKLTGPRNCRTLHPPLTPNHSTLWERKNKNLESLLQLIKPLNTSEVHMVNYRASLYL